MKKGGGAQATMGANNSNAAQAMAETQGGVKFELVGLPECMDENLASS